jgi:hypothetical protein
LFDLKLSTPEALTSDDFKTENARLQHEINGAQVELKKTEERFQSLEETMHNVFEFATSAKDCFERGDTEVRKSICQLLGVSYVLTLGNLEIKPHPLLAPIIAFEPTENSSENHQMEESTDLFPEWQSIWDEVLTLATNLDVSFSRLECFG